MPPWCRRSPKVAEVLPLLYLHGLSTAAPVEALEEVMGGELDLCGAIRRPPSTGMLGAPLNHRATSRGEPARPRRRFVPLDGAGMIPRTHEGRKGKVMATVTDPVCGMEIDSAMAAASEEYGGKTYYFCSEGCHQRFVAAPEQYAV